MIVIVHRQLSSYYAQIKADDEESKGIALYQLRYGCLLNTAVEVEVEALAGHGLTYSKFEYQDLQLKQVVSMDMDLLVVVSLELENVGPVEAAEVVQCYVHDIDSTVYRPYHELKGFEKVLLKPTEKTNVSVALDHRAFSFWDVGTQQWVLEAGEFEIQIGSSSRDIRLRKNVMLESPQTASVQAKKSHPPVPLPLTKLNDSDDQFKNMKGKDIPAASHATKLHYNSLLGDTAHTFIGRTIQKRGLTMMLRNVRDPPEHQVKFSKELLEHTPLRSLVLFSRGGMSFGLLDVIIHLMNGEILSALRKFPWVIVSLIYEKIFVRSNSV